MSVTEMLLEQILDELKGLRECFAAQVEVTGQDHSPQQEWIETGVLSTCKIKGRYSDGH